MMLAVALMMVAQVRSENDPKPVLQADLDFVRSIADAVDANLAKFPHGSARYRFQDGFAASQADARAGRLDKLAEAPCIYKFDDAHNIYEQVYPLATLAAATVWEDESRYGSRLSSSRGVTNGLYSLKERISSARDGQSYLYGHNLDRAAGDFFAGVSFPLDLGFKNRGGFSSTLRAGVEGLRKVRIEEVDRNATWEGRKVVKVCLTYPNARVEYWIDLDRGSIPVFEHHFVVGKLSSEEFDEKIELVPGHGWFPFVTTTCLRNNRVQRVEIDQVDFDRPPAPAEFQMQTAEPVRLTEPLTNLPFLESHQIWDLDHLPFVDGSSVPANPPGR